MGDDGKRIKLLIADDDKTYANIMRDYFSLLPEYEVCGCVYNGRDALYAIEHQALDFVILDLAMPYYDGLFVVDGIDKMPPSLQPYVIILSSLPYNKAVSRRLEENSNRYFMPKPISLECLHSYMLSEYQGEKEAAPRKHFPEDKLNLLLDRMNIAPCTKGKSYIISAMRLLDIEPDLLHALGKELYNKIGERHMKASSQAVERDIRHAVKAAWDKDEGAAMKAVFAGYGIDVSVKPTNSNFLVCLLQIMNK